MFCQVLTLLARRRLPELASHFDTIDFSVDMVSERSMAADTGAVVVGGISFRYMNLVFPIPFLPTSTKMTHVGAGLRPTEVP